MGHVPGTESAVIGKCHQAGCHQRESHRGDVVEERVIAKRSSSRGISMERSVGSVIKKCDPVGIMEGGIIKKGVINGYNQGTSGHVKGNRKGCHRRVNRGVVIWGRNQGNVSK